MRCLTTPFAIAALCGAVAAQGDWTLLKPSTPLPRRGDHTLVADGASLWFFGGRPQPGNFVANDTWRYLGNTWVKQNPAASPSGRWHARATFDTSRGRVVLFGGRAPNGVFFNDTWEIVGTSWAKVATQTSPPPRERCGLAYDAKRKLTIMFGGRGTGNAVLGDMWAYDGSSWTKLSPTPLPPARWHPCMAYDKDREVIVLFGGSGNAGASGALDDTWEWDGTRWTKMSPTTSPPKTYVSSIVYDEYRGRMVMFAGVNTASSYLGTTWEYDGTTWTQRAPKTAPPGRGGSPLAYLPSRKAVFAYGGFHPATKQLSDFWKYETTAPASTKVSGAGCRGAGGTAAMAATSLPWAGDSLDLEVTGITASAPVLVSFGLSKTMWGPFRLPLSLAPFRAPGCTLYTGLDLLLPARNSGGRARVSLPLPADTALAGATIYDQGLVVDATANQLRLVFSNLVESTIGLR